MLEAIFGCITLSAWALGLYFYPTFMDAVSECCERQSEQSLIMDETVANYVHEEISIDSVLTAKEVKSGESPLFMPQNKLPVAKPLKYL